MLWKKCIICFICQHAVVMNAFNLNSKKKQPPNQSQTKTMKFFSVQTTLEKTRLLYSIWDII